MNIIINPGKVNGCIQAKSSKSIAQRVIIASSLAKGTSIIHNCPFNEDVENLLKAVDKLGCTIAKKNDTLKIQAGYNPEYFNVNTGESGLAARIIIPVLAVAEQEFVIDGTGSLKNRPFGLFEKIFNDAGVQFRSNGGYLPIEIKGSLKSGNYSINGSIGSQFLSGLLFAFPLVKGDTKLDVTNLKSIPYIDLTIDVLDSFGISVQNQNYKTFFIPGDQQYCSTEIHVENDWSNAAFLLVAGAVSGSVSLKGLNKNSKQGDKIILEVLKMAGANICMDKNKTSCSHNILNAFKFDATHYPDLFPPLVALAANCKGTSEIKGAHRLIHKESNRAKALINEFGKLGIKIIQENDLIKVRGGSLKAASVDSWNDHRIAMSLAIAALNAENKVIINNFDCINKSYPEFLSDLKSIGVDVS